MLHPRQRQAVVLDAEVDVTSVAVAAEVGDERVVGVEHERVRAAPTATTSAQRSAIVSSSP